MPNTPTPDQRKPRQPRMREELVQALERARLAEANRDGGRYVALKAIGQQVTGQGGHESTIKRVRDLDSRAPIEAIVDAYAVALDVDPQAIYKAALRAWKIDPAGDTFINRYSETQAALAALEGAHHVHSLAAGRARAEQARQSARESSRKRRGKIQA